jgi:hypothetical protein
MKIREKGKELTNEKNERVDIIDKQMSLIQSSRF